MSRLPLFFQKPSVNLDVTLQMHVVKLLSVAESGIWRNREWNFLVQGLGT